jgi:dihydrofolate reductase
MARLIYAAIASLDGYVNDREGGFEWSAPDDEVHAFVNELERTIGTHLYGRRLYEVMAFWETGGSEPDESGPVRDYAEIWRATDKVVYSTTLEAVRTSRTRLERTFDPEAVRRMKAEAGRDLGVGGPGLAAHAIRAGLVDELHLFLVPVLVGGGTRALPDDAFVRLELVDERRFAGGVVHLHHRVLV